MRNLILKMIVRVMVFVVRDVSMWVYSMFDCVIGMEWNCLKMLFCMLVNSWNVV